MLEIGAPGVQLGEEHLVQHLRRRQVPHLAGDGGGAEGAAHAAAHLGGDAHGVPVVILHQNRLDAVAVGQLPQVFDGAVQPRLLLAGHLGRRDETASPPASRRRALERLVISSKEVSPPVQPGKHLLGPEGGLAQLSENRLPAPPGVMDLISVIGHPRLISVHAADVKAVRAVALGPQRQLSRCCAPIGPRQREAARVQTPGARRRKAVRHVLIFLRQHRAGGVDAACRRAAHSRRRSPGCPRWIAGQLRQLLGILVADIRLLADDAQSRAGHVRHDEISAARSHAAWCSRASASSARTQSRCPSALRPALDEPELVGMDVAGEDLAPVPPCRWRAAKDLPPGAAHTSSTRSAACGAGRPAATSRAAASCTMKRPSRERRAAPPDCPVPVTRKQPGSHGCASTVQPRAPQLTLKISERPFSEYSSGCAVGTGSLLTRR